MSDVSTARGVHGAKAALRGRNLRRVGVALMILLVAAGSIGVFDGRPASNESTGGGWTLKLDAPGRTRGGLPIPLSLTVHHVGGFGTAPISLRLSRDLLDEADFQQWYPNPSAETGDPDWVRYEFDPPPGDTLAVHLDARMQPNQPPGVLPITIVLDPPGVDAVTVVHDVVVLP